MLSKSCPDSLKEKNPALKLDLEVEKIHVKISESLYYTMHFIIDIMKPTKNLDHWAVVEQSKNEIKKNCKVFGKILKKNNFNKTSEYFAVLSGGYIYFYKHVDDDNFEKYFFIKDAIISEKIHNEKNESNINILEYTINLKNKYGNIDIILPNENKYKSWINGLKERINEMKSYQETIQKPDISKFKLEENQENNNNENNKTEIIQKNKPKKNEQEKNSTQELVNPLKLISFALHLDIKNVKFDLVDEANDNTVIFKLEANIFYLDFILRELDIELSLGLQSIQLFDEKYKHDNSFYEIITSIDKEDSNMKLFSLYMIISDEGSPIKKNAGMDLDLKFGYLYAVWQPQSIKRILLFVAHNDILRDKIKAETTIPKFSENLSSDNFISDLEKKTSINQQELTSYPKEGDNHMKINENLLLENEEEFVSLKCNDSPDLYLFLKLNLQKVKIIWVQPQLNHYFMELCLEESNIFFEMTYDHLKIYGDLGNTQLKDLTNYPYTIKNQSEFLELEKKKHFFTEILGFKTSSSLAFEYSSYSLICPLCKDNYTSKAKVEFNSVRLNYIQEHFFRMFNYLFDDFLGALSAPQEIKDYKNSFKNLPKLKEEEMEFMDLSVIFNNPQILLKPRHRLEESFLADLGTVTIKNNYNLVKNKSKKFPEKEKWISSYSFDLKDFNITTNNNFELIEKTNGNILINFINLTNEEKLITDPDLIDKSFDFIIKLDDINLNLRQNDFTTLMKCSDLNFVFEDGMNKYYVPDTLENEDLKDKNLNNDAEYIYKCLDYNYMRMTLDIPNISLALYENPKDEKKSEKIKFLQV